MIQGFRRAESKALEIREHTMDQLAKLERDRARRPFVDIAFAIRDLDDRIAGRELASAVAYRIFFLLLPITLVVVGGLGLSGELAVEAPKNAARASGISSAVATSIAKSTESVSLSVRLAILATGLLGTFLAARAMAKTLNRVHAAAWDRAGTKVAHKARAAGVIVGLMALLLLATAVSNRLRSQAGLAGLVLTIAIAALLYSGIVLVLHTVLLRPDGVPWPALLPGAVVMGLALGVLQGVALGYFAHSLSRSSDLYGGIGIAVVVLFWLYIIGRVLVVGPILNSVLWEHRSSCRPSPSAT